MAITADNISAPRANKVPSANEGFGNELPLASVLVIDDEPGMRNFLQKILAEVCAKVDVTDCTQNASDLLDKNTYDVIVLDNIMPDKTGLQWLAEQRQIGLFSDAILITAREDNEERLLVSFIDAQDGAENALATAVAEVAALSAGRGAGGLGVLGRGHRGAWRRADQRD